MVHARKEKGRVYSFTFTSRTHFKTNSRNGKMCCMNYYVERNRISVKITRHASKYQIETCDFVWTDIRSQLSETINLEGSKRATVGYPTSLHCKHGSSVNMFSRVHIWTTSNRCTLISGLSFV